MGRSSAPYGGRAPEPLNRSGTPAPSRCIGHHALDQPADRHLPEIPLRNCSGACEQLGSGRSVRSSDPGAETRSLFVESPARET